jgi:PAS domain S-box-containing protein
MSPTSPPAVRPLTDAERFRLLVDAVSDHAIYMLDARGFVTSWNSGGQRLTGYATDEILGQHFSRFFTLEDHALGLPSAILDEAMSTGRCETEGWRVRKNGTRFWGLAVLQQVLDDSGTLIGFAEITRDITERQAAHEALRESERRFQLLMQGVVEYAIYMLDPSGVVTNWNAGAERIKGYTAAEIIGRHFSQFYSKEERAAGVPAQGLSIAAREGHYEAEGWRVRKDGGRFWASVVIDPIRSESGELLGFAKITRDITERNQAQEALRESERQFRLLVDGVTDYAIYMLDPNGIVTNWNAGAQRIKGYSADEIIGQHFSKFYPENERATGAPARNLHTATSTGHYAAEGWRVRKDGTLFWANVVISPIRDEHGQLIGFAKITRDITERHEADKVLQRTQAQLAHAQKMDALGHLTGGVAHDFNNLLMIVSGHLQTLKRLIGDDPKGIRAAQAIEVATKRGESLTRQLLSFSRRQSLNPVVIALPEAMENIRTLLASSIGTSTDLSASIGPEVWPVEADLNELELALVNLTLNARDAMGRDGTVRISAENVVLAQADTLAGISGEFVALTVADTGCGIPEDILPKVFDPFFTTKQAGKGTGLGLSQVHGFAHQIGGTVTLASELNRGTRVTLYLPRARGTPASAVPDAATEAAGGVVLLVEDNPEVAEVTKGLLEQLGCRVEVAPQAQAALDALARATFDLVVSDIIMPGAMNGVELAYAIRERHPKLPVILASGYSKAADQAAHAFAVLRKPYQLNELSRVMAWVQAEAQKDAGGKLVSFQDARRGRKSQL